MSIRQGIKLLTGAVATLMSFGAHAQEAVTYPNWSADFFLELRNTEDLRDRPQTKSRQAIQEISLGGDYRFDERVASRVELSVEQFDPSQTDPQSTFFVKNAFIDYSPWPQFTRLRIGQQFLPVGLINERDHWFSSNPPFLRRLLTVHKAIDLGATMQLTPPGLSLAAPRAIYLEAAVFAGRLVRPADERTASPQKPPTIVSLKSESAYHNAFLTRFEHDLAFYDPVKAWGLGLEGLAPQGWRVRPRLLTEYWHFDEIQKQGPDQRNRAWLVYAQLDWWRLSVGHRWSQNAARLAAAGGSDALPLEISKLYSLDVNLAKGVTLRGERIYEKQSTVTRNEWVARAMVKWQFP